MTEELKPCAATPSADLEAQIMDSNVPKNEREWWAHHKIATLRAENALIREALEAVAENTKRQQLPLTSQLHGIARNALAQVAK